MEYMRDHLQRAGGGATLVYPAASNLMLKSYNGVSPSDAPDGYSSYSSSRQGVDISSTRNTVYCIDCVRTVVEPLLTVIMDLTHALPFDVDIRRNR